MSSLARFWIVLFLLLPACRDAATTMGAPANIGAAPPAQPALAATGSTPDAASTGPAPTESQPNPTAAAAANASASGTPPLTPSSKPRSKDASLTTAMVEFVQALRARDVEKLLTLFPREKPLKISSAIAGTDRIPFAQAAAEMRARNRNEGLYSILVDAPDPTFAQYVIDGVEWTWAGGTRFVPDGESRNSNVYILWRKEKSAWVIDTIGFPLS